MKKKMALAFVASLETHGRGQAWQAVPESPHNTSEAGLSAQSCQVKSGVRRSTIRKRKEVTLFAAGILMGALLVPTAHAAAKYLAATPSTQSFYVDGTPVQLEAYTINDNNYVKLRDIGEAVGFNVYWDGAVQVDSDAPYTGTPPVQENGHTGNLTYNSDGSLNVPADGSKYIPQAGDVIRCDDGTNYTITDVSRYDSNVFAEGPAGDLPAPTCDWSAFPTIALPPAEAKRIITATGEDLFVRNLYETRRMQYTIYNALGQESGVWRDGKPLATVQLAIPIELDDFTKFFWPWRDSELEKLVHSRPNSTYYVEAWDVYHNGIFQQTRYCVVSL